MTASERVSRRGRIFGGGLRLVGFAICAASLLGVDASQPTVPGISVTVAGVAARYVSNRTFTGTVTVTNATDADLHYTVQMTGTLTYPRDIYNISAFAPSEVKAHSHNTSSFAAQACEVLSDPCQGSIVASVTIVETKASMHSAAAPYTAYADPTATFRFGEVRGNIPIFAATGTTQYVVPADTLVVFLEDAHAQRSVTIPPELQAAIEWLKKRGIDGNVSYTMRDGDVSVRVAVPAAIDIAAVDVALAQIVGRFGERLGVKREYIADYHCLEPRDQASLVQPIAAYVGAPSLRLAGGLLGPMSVNMYGARNVAPFLDSDEPCRTVEPRASPGTYELFARSVVIYAGYSPATRLTMATLFPSTSGIEAFGLDESWFVAPVGHFEIASDRLEISAMAVAYERVANERGIDDSIAAFSIAAARARELARALGVTAGPLSLVVTYGPRSLKPTVDLAAVRIAYAVNGAARLPAMPTPSPTPTPIPTHTPGVPYAVFMQASTPGPPQAPRPPADTPATPDPVAIAAPLATTLVTASGDAAVTAAADENAITIRVRSNPSATKPLTNAAMARLRAAVGARQDVAFVTIEDASDEVAMHVLTKGTSASTLRAIVALVRKSSTPNVAIFTSALSMLSDCRATAYAAQAASVMLAESRAAQLALAQGRRLRRLLIASASLPRVAGTCAPALDNIVFYSATDPAFPIPDHPTVRIDVPVTLTYRTWDGPAR